MLTALTIVHVLISLIGIASGFVVLVGFLTNRPLPGWTKIFLLTTVLTSATGFLFPVDRLLPSHVLGILSLIALAVAIYALYGRKLSGMWRPAYVITAVLAQYFNFFVLIVQSFLKIPGLHTLAPTQAEPPFVIAQSIALVAFLVIGIASTLRFRAVPTSAV